MQSPLEIYGIWPYMSNVSSVVWSHNFLCLWGHLYSHIIYTKSFLKSGCTILHNSYLMPLYLVLDNFSTCQNNFETWFPNHFSYAFQLGSFAHLVNCLWCLHQNHAHLHWLWVGQWLSPVPCPQGFSRWQRFINHCSLIFIQSVTLKLCLQILITN